MALDERLQLDAALHERQIEQGPAIGRRWFASATCGRACRVLFGGPFPMPQMSRAVDVHKLLVPVLGVALFLSCVFGS